MNDPGVPSSTPPLPSVAQLLRAVALGLAVAGVILLVAVLPAEYGIDPTGIGERIGLLRPRPASAIDVSVPVDPAAAATVDRSETPFRTDQLTLTLQPGETAEIKATMTAGATYVFSWAAHGGTVDFDMHGARADGGAGEASYWKGEGAAGGHGAFRAPFSGQHGWFWQNTTWQPVTIVVTTSGFYSAIGRIAK